MGHRLTGIAVAVAYCFATGCGDSGLVETDTPVELVGSWTATSLVWGGNDLTLGGTTLTLSFAADGSFSGSSTNSPTGLFCDPGPDCQISGVYTATSTQLVFDSNDPPEDQTPMGMSVDATTLILSGPIEGQDGVFAFGRAP